MSIKKIDRYDANNISEAMANAAFKHLLVPYHEQADKFALQAYQSLTAGLPLDLMVERGFARRHIAKISVGVQNTSGESQYLMTTKDIDHVTHTSYGAMELVDSALYDAVEALTGMYAHYFEQRNSLRNEIAKQIEGKSAHSVLKNWPEAAPFLQARFGDLQTSGMTVPLEQLLARFLPMLPAPQPA